MTDNENTHLQRIIIRGFKSIKSLDLKMSPINILIGANGSGKSNFISIFNFLRNLSEGKLQKYVETQGFANVLFHFGSKETSNITIDLEVGLNRYHVDFSHGSNDTLVFDKEICRFSGSTKDFPVRGMSGESGLLPGSEAKSSYVRQYTREYLQDCRVYHFHDTSASAAFKQAEELNASDYLYGNAGNLAPFLYRLRQEYGHSYAEIRSAIQAVAPFFHDFYLEPRGEHGNEKIILKWSHRDHETPFSANQLSDGTARFICMATLFLQPQQLKPNTLILDEPELGLHPAALDVLADIVKSAAKTSQVICSTQSVEFANQFRPEDFIVVDQVGGASEFNRPNAELLDQWLQEYRMGEIWTKNLVGGRPEW
ncbi:MAG: AAA family ATPase [Gammaproteobacteria bacterium]|nr:AAA family ATPase [Gammaproteobacteria bacterium]